MKAKEIFENLLAEASVRKEQTCDRLVSGDENKEVAKIAVCFKLTAEVLTRAIESGADMLITHEPVFSAGYYDGNPGEFDLKKEEVMKKSGIAVYRYHDHAHDAAFDYIHHGFIKDTGLDIRKLPDCEAFAVAGYELGSPMTAREFARHLEEKMGIEFVRVIGACDFPVKKICLGLGNVGYKQLELMFDKDCDLFITGEMSEVCVCEYVRDAAFYGAKKALLVVGHYSAEFSGMKLLCEKLFEKGISAEYIDSGEVYYRV